MKNNFYFYYALLCIITTINLIMWYIIIGIIALYITYRLCVSTIFPSINNRRLKKYQDDFFKKNPHIDREKFRDLSQKR